MTLYRVGTVAGKLAVIEYPVSDVYASSCIAQGLAYATPGDAIDGYIAGQGRIKEECDRRIEEAQRLREGLGSEHTTG